MTAHAATTPPASDQAANTRLRRAIQQGLANVRAGGSLGDDTAEEVLALVRRVACRTDWQHVPEQHAARQAVAIRPLTPRRPTLQLAYVRASGTR